MMSFTSVQEERVLFFTLKISTRKLIGPYVKVTLRKPCSGPVKFRLWQTKNLFGLDSIYDPTFGSLWTFVHFKTFRSIKLNSKGGWVKTFPIDSMTFQLDLNLHKFIQTYVCGSLCFTVQSTLKPIELTIWNFSGSELGPDILHNLSKCL